MNTLKYTLFILVLSLSLFSRAQVGINNPFPDPSTVLDLSGGANVGKGLLLTGNDAVGIPLIAAPANGLIVMDTLTKEFYIYNNDSTKWYSGNPWTKELGVNLIITNNSVNITSNLDVSNTITTQTTNTTNLNANKILGSGSNPYIENINGAVPPGVIVMWSGSISNIPNGWALCDGRKYLPNGTVFTCPLPPIACFIPSNLTVSPNLKGKFIVGYDSSDPDYDQIHNVYGTGGEKEHTLSANESGIPAFSQSLTSTGSTTSNGIHKHHIASKNSGTSGSSIKQAGTTGSNGNYTDIDGGHSHNVSVSGIINKSAQNASQAHENRPPYYTLAYIIKLKNH